MAKRGPTRGSGNPNPRYKATMPEAFSFESQARQYPVTGPPGISYFRGEDADLLGPDRWIDCLLYRDVDGHLIGILNHYPFDFPPWEQEGAMNVFVHPDCQRQGVGTLLVEEADRRWGLDMGKQRFTEEGARFANALARRGLLSGR